MISEITRAMSNETVDRRKRYREIRSILHGKEMTAKEVAVEMCQRGYTPTTERNFAAPRLTELVKQGQVVVTGKKIC